MTPTASAWDVVRTLPRSQLIYNRSDKHSEFAEARAEIVRSLERTLLRKAEYVLYVSHELMREEAQETGERALFLDHGVDLDLFRPREGGEPADLCEIPRPRVGFFGGLRGGIVDFDLLEAVAVGCPEAHLVLVGDSDTQMRRLTRHSNVHWLGQRPYERVPEYGSGFDVAIMPFLANDWVRCCNPIKLKEYLALGLPVVTTPFPEAEFYRAHLRIRQGHAAFVDGVRQCLVDGGPGNRRSRRAAVRDRSWERVSETLLGLIARNP